MLDKSVKSRGLLYMRWIIHWKHTWAEITLRQHHLWPSQCFVLIKPVGYRVEERKKTLLDDILVFCSWCLDIDCIAKAWSLLTVGFPLSAPVLSWLFIALGKVASYIPWTSTGLPKESAAWAAVSPSCTRFLPGTPRPNPQSQSFFRRYGSILPTSL